MTLLHASRANGMCVLTLNMCVTYTCDHVLQLWVRTSAYSKQLQSVLSIA